MANSTIGVIWVFNARLINTLTVDNVHPDMESGFSILLLGWHFLVSLSQLSFDLIFVIIFFSIEFFAN